MLAMDKDQLYSISDTAKKIGVSTQTLRRWDKNGKFCSKRHPINNYRVYSKDQIETFVSELGSDTNHNFNIQTLDDYIPFFETKIGKLYNMDAFEFLKAIPDSSVDLVFADPPYNIKKAEWDTFESQKQYIEWSMEWIKESSRILSDQGSLYICGFQKFWQI